MLLLLLLTMMPKGAHGLNGTNGGWGPNTLVLAGWLGAAAEAAVVVVGKREGGRRVE